MKRTVYVLILCLAVLQPGAMVAEPGSGSDPSQDECRERPTAACIAAHPQIVGIEACAVVGEIRVVCQVSVGELTIALAPPQPHVQEPHAQHGQQQAQRQSASDGERRGFAGGGGRERHGFASGGSASAEHTARSASLPRQVYENLLRDVNGAIVRAAIPARQADEARSARPISASQLLYGETTHDTQGRTVAALARDERQRVALRIEIPQEDDPIADPGVCKVSIRQPYQPVYANSAHASADERAQARESREVLALRAAALMGLEESCNQFVSG